MLKHYGILANTGTKVIVVFRTIPEDAKHCLVIDRNTVPDRLADSLDKVVKGFAAQEITCNNLYEILNKNVFVDQSNMLTTLHHAGLLRKVPVSNVLLTPAQGVTLPLAIANAAIDGVSELVAETTIPDQYDTPVVEAKSPIHSEALDLAVKYDLAGTEPEMQAQRLLLECEILMATARKKREEAHALDPSLVTVGNTKHQVQLELTSKLAVKANDARMGAKHREENVADELDALVAQKIATDAVNANNPAVFKPSTGDKLEIKKTTSKTTKPTA